MSALLVSQVSCETQNHSIHPFLFFLYFTFLLPLSFSISLRQIPLLELDWELAGSLEACVHNSVAICVSLSVLTHYNSDSPDYCADSSLQKSLLTFSLPAFPTLTPFSFPSLSASRLFLAALSKPSLLSAALMLPVLEWVNVRGNDCQLCVATFRMELRTVSPPLLLFLTMLRYRIASVFPPNYIALTLDSQSPSSFYF